MEGVLKEIFALTDLKYTKERDRLLSMVSEESAEIMSELSGRGLGRSSINLNKQYKIREDAIWKLCLFQINNDWGSLRSKDVILSDDVTNRVIERAEKIIIQEIGLLQTTMSELEKKILGRDIIPGRLKDSQIKMLSDMRREVDILFKEYKLNLSSPSGYILGMNVKPFLDFQQHISNIFNNPEFVKQMRTVQEQANQLRQVLKHIDFAPIYQMMERANSKPLQESFIAFKSLSEKIRIMSNIDNDAFIKAIDSYRHIAYGESLLIRNYLYFNLPHGIIVKDLTPAEEPSASKKVDSLLYKISPALVNKRKGAWDAFYSDNPDRLSQTSSSLVELLSHIYEVTLNGLSLREYLTKKHGEKGIEISNEEIKWINSVANLLRDTKAMIQRVKHHTDYKLNSLVETLLKNVDCIILLLLG